MTRTLTVFALAAAALAMPATAKSLKSEPPQLDPAKAYVLVEVDTAKHMPAGQIILARYDLVRGDIRGRGPAADSGKPPAGEGTDRPMLKDGGRHCTCWRSSPISGWLKARTGPLSRWDRRASGSRPAPSPTSASR